MQPLARANCLITAGVVVALICVVFMASFRPIFNSVVNNMLVISPDNAIFDTFNASSDIPIYMDLNLFDVKNPDEVKNNGSKPVLEQKGPYRYVEKYVKFDYVWHDDGSVEYKENTTYFFDEKNSNGTEDDLITSLNPIMVILAAMEYKNPVLNAIWGGIEDAMSLFEEHKVREWMFEGYELPDFYFEVNGMTLNGSIYEILLQLGQDIPQLEGNKFGYNYGVNGSNDGVLRIYTGEKGMDNYHYILEYNYQSRLNYWGEDGKGDDPYCNMINGTDGTQYPPGVKKDQILPVFDSSLCRSIDFVYEREITIQDEIDAYRFILPPEALESGNTNERNKCYCIPLPYEPLGSCLNDTMLIISPCMGGAPIILSTPHFYQGNNADKDNFIGLEPSKKLHETFLDVEPITGVVMQAAKRIQVNLPLRKYGILESFRHVPDVVFPIFWLAENAVVPKDDAETAHLLLYGLFTIVYIVLAVFLLVGLVCIGFGGRRRCQYLSKKEDVENEKKNPSTSQLS